MTWLASLVGLVLLAPSADAGFQGDTYCPQAFQVGELRSALDVVEQSLDSAQVERARRILLQARDAMPCLYQPVDKYDLARFARNMSLVAFFEQNEVDAVRWAVVSKRANPKLPWGSTYPPGHGFRTMVEGAKTPITGRAEGKMLAPPPKGGLFLDGDFLAEPVAVADVPHLVQVFDARGAWSDAYWQDGAAFRDKHLVDGSGPVPPPRWWAGSGSSAPAVTEKPPKAPKAPGGGPPVAGIVTLATGGALGVATGVLYVMASSRAADVPHAATPAELTQIRTDANVLVVASSATGLVGAGLIGTGIALTLVDGRPSIGLGVRF